MVYVICFKLFWFDVLYVIGIPFRLYNFRTRDRKYWGESVHVEMTKVQRCTFIRGEFSLILDHGSLILIFSLLCNVATSILPSSGTS